MSSTQATQAVFIGLDKYQNPRFRITSEHDAKSMTRIHATNLFLKANHESLYSPIFADEAKDFGLITLHRILGLDVEVGATYSFAWRGLISRNATGRDYVKVDVANFLKVKDAEMVIETEIPFEAL